MKSIEVDWYWEIFEPVSEALQNNKDYTNFPNGTISVLKNSPMLQ